MIEVWSNTEFGHVFSVVKLDKPGPKGRMFRLFDNGQPALGGQWHYTVANAIARAEYVLQGSYSRRIAYLEQRVQVLEAQIGEATTAEIKHLKAASPLHLLAADWSDCPTTPEEIAAARTAQEFVL